VSNTQKKRALAYSKWFLLAFGIPPRRSSLQIIPVVIRLLKLFVIFSESRLSSFLSVMQSMNARPRFWGFYDVRTRAGSLDEGPYDQPLIVVNTLIALRRGLPGIA